MNEHPVILFDGICNLCNGAIQFIIKHDKQGLFHFASLQSEAGQKLLLQYGLPRDQFNSFVLIQHNKAYLKSAAALKIASQLKGFIRLLNGFIIVPLFIRDSVYNLISKYRYTWFGKRNECMLPTPGLSSRFLN